MHTMKHCYETALSSGIRYTCAYSLPHIYVVYGRNEEYLPVSRIKNGQQLCVCKYENAIAIFEMEKNAKLILERA